MKILLVGDLHGHRQSGVNIFAHACRVDADRIIQLGDFGFGWSYDDHEAKDTYSAFLSEFATECGIPFYWLDGNHENHDILQAFQKDNEAQPDGTFETAPGVYYIPRGTMLDWDGCKILVCGGAQSVDVDVRVPYIEWWPQEIIQDWDIEKCKAAGQADILLTHDAPLGSWLEEYLNTPNWPKHALLKSYDNRKKVLEILQNCGAKYQWCGHLHLHVSDMLRGGVKLTVLDQGLTPMNECTKLIDTQYYGRGNNVS
jgi:predicted phosphodiesterase